MEIMVTEIVMGTDTDMVMDMETRDSVQEIKETSAINHSPATKDLTKDSTKATNTLHLKPHLKPCSTKLVRLSVATHSSLPSWLFKMITPPTSRCPPGTMTAPKDTRWTAITVGLLLNKPAKTTSKITSKLISKLLTPLLVLISEEVRNVLNGSPSSNLWVQEMVKTSAMPAMDNNLMPTMTMTPSSTSLSPNSTPNI